VLAASEPALPRLPGSARETAVCARAWSKELSGASLLMGLDASRSRVIEAVSRGPAAVHFSVHVSQPEGHPEDGSIALSLEPDGTAGVLSPTDISALKLNASLVVMSACNSGRGRILPSAGLLGLTRAWLLAGARSVVASLWPVSDDSGGLFAHFYAEFRPRLDSPSKWDAAFALRKAQVECLRAGSWRAEPRYWAAFFAMGRE
jgi:CHAT domain-containing protein